MWEYWPRQAGRSDTGDLLPFYFVGPAPSAGLSRQGSWYDNAFAWEGVMAGMKVRDRSGDEGMSAVSVQHGSDVSAARLVVVEDNSSDVYLLERALRKQNLRFETASPDQRKRSPGPSSGGRERWMRQFRADAGDLTVQVFSEDIWREIRGATHLIGVPVCVWSSSRSPRDERSQDLG